MGLFLQQSDQRSKLQSQLAKELREKVKAAQESAGSNSPVDPELLANERQTRPAGMIIAVIVFVTVIIVGILFATSI